MRFSDACYGNRLYDASLGFVVMTWSTCSLRRGAKEALRNAACSRAEAEEAQAREY